MQTITDVQKLKQLMEELSFGKLNDDEAARHIYNLGYSGYLAAEPIIAEYLESSAPVLRSEALRVLLDHFSLQKYIPKCLAMLKTDPDEVVRFDAALLLSWITDEEYVKPVLEALSAIIADPNNLKTFRQAAYSTYQEIIRKAEFAHIVQEPLNLSPDIAWD